MSRASIDFEKSSATTRSSPRLSVSLARPGTSGRASASTSSATPATSSTARQRRRAGENAGRHARDHLVVPDALDEPAAPLPVERVGDDEDGHDRQEPQSTLDVAPGHGNLRKRVSESRISSSVSSSAGATSIG